MKFLDIMEAYTNNVKSIDEPRRIEVANADWDVLAEKYKSAMGNPDINSAQGIKFLNAVIMPNPNLTEGSIEVFM